MTQVVFSIDQKKIELLKKWLKDQRGNKKINYLAYSIESILEEGTERKILEDSRTTVKEINFILAYGLATGRVKMDEIV